jgi:DNA-binding response OmpR family regulator
VLLVDDSLEVRVTFLEILAREGFDAFQAADGREGVDRALALRPDVVVMDLSLPVMGGIEATRLLRADDRTRAIPVVALTGRPVSARDRVAALFDAVLVKPCLPEVLVARVRALLPLTFRAQAGSRTPSGQTSG